MQGSPGRGATTSTVGDRGFDVDALTSYVLTWVRGIRDGDWTGREGVRRRVSPILMYLRRLCATYTPGRVGYIGKVLCNVKRVRPVYEDGEVEKAPYGDQR